MANVIGEPRVVEAGRGAAWWGEGWHIFTSNFWTWIGIMIVYIVITMLISLVPFVGSFGHWLLTPVFMGGLMLGCQAIDRDEPLRVAHLFEGFQGAHFVPLMIIGAVNIALTAGHHGARGRRRRGRRFARRDDAVGRRSAIRLPRSAEWPDAFTGTGLLLVLIAVVIVAIFAMLNWFAPALVALDGATAVEAMKLSFFSSPAQLGAVSGLRLDRESPSVIAAMLVIGVSRIAVRRDHGAVVRRRRC